MWEQKWNRDSTSGQPRYRVPFVLEELSPWGSKVKYLIPEAQTYRCYFFLITANIMTTHTGADSRGFFDGESRQTAWGCSAKPSDGPVTASANKGRKLQSQFLPSTHKGRAESTLQGDVSSSNTWPPACCPLPNIPLFPSAFWSLFLLSLEKNQLACFYLHCPELLELLEHQLWQGCTSQENFKAGAPCVLLLQRHQPPFHSNDRELAHQTLTQIGGKSLQAVFF